MKFEAIKYSDYINGERFNEVDYLDKSYVVIKTASKVVIYTFVISQAPLLMMPIISTLKLI